MPQKSTDKSTLFSGTSTYRAYRSQNRSLIRTGTSGLPRRQASTQGASQVNAIMNIRQAAHTYPVLKIQGLYDAPGIKPMGTGCAAFRFITKKATTVLFFYSEYLKFQHFSPVAFSIFLIPPANRSTTVQPFSLVSDASHPVQSAPADIAQNPGSAYPDGVLLTPANQ